MLAAQDMLPPNVGEFETLVITREERTEVTENAPTSPGEIVLEGAIPQEQGEGGGGGAQPPAEQQPGG
jgi:3-polyprenyl-4-hydroxybenzoate decarboxylase